MSGNVWEWTASLFYDARRATYIVRGGSWNGNLDDARVAYRGNHYPDVSSINFGFRVVSPVF